LTIRRSSDGGSRNTTKGRGVSLSKVTIGHHEVHRPHFAVFVHPRPVGRREVQRDKRRVRPVEQPGRQPAVLAEREPPPDRIAASLPVGGLAKVAEQVQLQLPDVEASGCQPQEAAGQVSFHRGMAAERKRGSEPAERRVPGSGKKQVDERGPRARPLVRPEARHRCDRHAAVLRKRHTLTACQAQPLPMLESRPFKEMADA
jgi:hypothetical protein